jgi:hypothetical protein
MPLVSANGGVTGDRNKRVNSMEHVTQLSTTNLLAVVRAAGLRGLLVRSSDVGVFGRIYN